MKPKIKVAIIVGAALMSSALAASVFVPVLEIHSRECLYCGDRSNLVRVFGIDVCRLKPGGDLGDGFSLPNHTHRSADLSGSRMWVFKPDENWDTFGWAARNYREALRAGLAAHPDRRAEILAEYFAVVPSDVKSQERFIKQYGTPRTEQAGAGQPATRPVVEPEGGDKPQPEAEGRRP